jgi:hypothetical protein
MSTRTAKATLSRSLFASVFVFGAATLGADCEGNIVQDPAFRDWCGNALCSWQTDVGQIARVPTWDANDFGVAFVTDGYDGTGGTEISQVTQENQATCVTFTSVGNFDTSADMNLGVDFNNDGAVDQWYPLGSAAWQRVSAEITAPPSYQGITFYVRKEGTGTAVLAEMAITSTTGCTAAPPPLPPAKLGQACSSTSQCATGLVCPEPMGGTYRTCGQCSEESPCAGGVVCAQRSVFFPLQCAPGQGLGGSDAPCLANDDCASGECVGAMPEGLGFEDAGPCDLNTVGADAASCGWDIAVGGTCR